MFKFELKRKLGIKNTYLKIDKTGKITVSGGMFLTKKYAKKFVESKREWIQKKIDEIEKINITNDPISKNKSFYYLGEIYDISIIIDQKISRAYFKFINNKLLIYSNRELENDQINYFKDEFYRNQVKEIIPNIVKIISKKTELHPNKISFRKAKTRWGSCNNINNISFSIYLAALPIELIEHVVLHEISHIKYKNHSKYFWQFVNLHCPDLKNKKKWLKEFSHII